MTVTDIDQVLCIGVKEPYFTVSDEAPGFWTKAQLEKSVNSKEDVLLVAEKDNEIVGFNITFVHIPSGKATMENLWVSEKYRKQGIAKQLIEQSLKELKSKNCVYLCNFVRDTNNMTMQLFEKLGFNRGHKFFWVDKNL